MPRKTIPTYETEKCIFAQRLTEIMKERGENQTTLAAKITSQFVAIQRQTISLYMNGQSKPDTERLTAIAKVLDVSADWLLGLTESKTQDADIRAMCDFTMLDEQTIYKLHELNQLEYISGFINWLVLKSDIQELEKNLRRAADARYAYIQQSHQTGDPITIGGIIQNLIGTVYTEEDYDTLKRFLLEGPFEEERIDQALRAGDYIQITHDEAAALFTERASGFLHGVVDSYILSLFEEE